MSPGLSALADDAILFVPLALLFLGAALLSVRSALR